MSTTLSEMDNILNGINNGLSSPLGLLALSLMQAGGPSRMPVSTGQALSQGYGGAQGMQGTLYDNQLKKLMLGFQAGKMGFIQQLNGQQPDSQDQNAAPQASPAANNPLMTAQTPTPTSTALDALASGQATPAQAQQISQTPLQKPADLSSNPLYSTLMGDPAFRTGMLMGAYGMPGGDKLMDAVTQRTQIQNLRQGGALFDPVTRQYIAQNPRLPEGATLTDTGGVVEAPGALSAIGQSAQAQSEAELYGKPTEVVDSTGQKHLTTVGRVMNPISYTPIGTPTVAPSTPTARAPSGSAAPRPQGGGNVTSLSPAVVKGMDITGTDATTSANEALTKQASFQQQLPQLNQLQANLDALGTGPGKESQLAAKSLLAAVPGFLGINGTFNADLTNAAAVKKTIVNMVAPAVRAMGAREPVQMVNFIRDGMASITNPADANAVVIGMLRGVAEYGNAQGQFAGDFLKKNNGAGFVPGQGSWQSQWQSHADPGAYIMENLPPFEQQAIIKEAETNATIRAEIQRMQKSGMWLQQNGYIRNSDLMGAP